jgi:hypothetical protein
MSIKDYEIVLSSQLNGKGDLTQPDGRVRRAFDISEKERPSGDRPIVTPTSSVAQAKDDENDFSEYALLVRRKLDKDGKQKGVQLEIQNHIIQDALRRVMPECAHLNLAAHPITIQSPYYELFQYRKEIRNYIEDLDRTEDERSYLDVLLRFMAANLAKIEKIHSQYHPHWTSTFRILWTYFRPETFVVYQCEHYQELYRVSRCHYTEDLKTKENFFELLVWSWEYNGTGFGAATTTLVLNEFQGARNLTEMELFPLECLPADEKSSIIARLIERGKRWRHLVHRSHQQYNGQSEISHSKPIYIMLLSIPLGPSWVINNKTEERRGMVFEKKDLVPIHV